MSDLLPSTIHSPATSDGSPAPESGRTRTLTMTFPFASFRPSLFSRDLRLLLDLTRPLRERSSSFSSKCVLSDPLADVGRLSGGNGKLSNASDPRAPGALDIVSCSPMPPSRLLLLTGDANVFGNCPYPELLLIDLRSVPPCDDVLLTVDTSCVVGNMPNVGEGVTGVESGLEGWLGLLIAPFGGCGKDPMLTFLPLALVGTGGLFCVVLRVGMLVDWWSWGVLRAGNEDGVTERELAGVGRSDEEDSRLEVIVVGVSGCDRVLDSGSGGRGEVGGGCEGRLNASNGVGGGGSDMLAVPCCMRRRKQRSQHNSA